MHGLSFYNYILDIMLFFLKINMSIKSVIRRNAPSSRLGREARDAEDLVYPVAQRDYQLQRPSIIRCQGFLVINSFNSVIIVEH